MSDFIKILHTLSALDQCAIDDLKAAISPKSYKKGELILQEGAVCRQLYFLDEGLVKLFFHKEGKEFIMRFFAEKSIFTGLDSYIKQTKSSLSMQALEPTLVCCIHHSKMDLLCKKHHCIETAFRKFIATAALNMMKRVSEMLEEDGAARYYNFVKTNGHLMQRISLGDLASYLGITQVSLSRIRARR